MIHAHTPLQGVHYRNRYFRFSEVVKSHISCPRPPPTQKSDFVNLFNISREISSLPGALSKAIVYFFNVYLFIFYWVFSHLVIPLQKDTE
jgi:hypothetical protein